MTNKHHTLSDQPGRDSQAAFRRADTSTPRAEGHHQSRHAARREDKENSGSSPLFPVWAPPLVMLAVIITGLVLSHGSGGIASAFFWLFALATLVCAVLVEARGLFLTIAPVPLYFVGGVGLIGWFSAAAGQAAGNKKTRLITAVYPAVEHFLWVLIPLALAIVVGVFRWWKYRDDLSRRQAREQLARHRRHVAERHNRESYYRAMARRQRPVANQEYHSRSVFAEDPSASDAAPQRTAGNTNLPSTEAPNSLSGYRSGSGETSRSGFAQDPQPGTINSERRNHTSEPVDAAEEGAVRYRRRSLDELREASAQRRRMPLPERRVAPRAYLDELSPRRSDTRD